MAIGAIGSSGQASIGQANANAMRQKMAEKLLSAMDTDKSGSVSKEEFVAFGEKLKAQGPAAGGSAAPVMPSSDELFGSADANGDQSLSVDELSSMMAQAETQGRAGGVRGGPPPGGPPPGGPPPGGASGSSKESSSSSSSKTTDPADANKDGTVSAAEKLIYSMTHPTSTTAS
jgi:hypothetical protein